MRVLDVFRQIRSRVVARDLAFSQELLKLPAVHLRKHPGLPEGQDASPIEGDRQLTPDFSLGFLGREPEGVDYVSRNFECELRHRW
jgi:hypothetical protein